MARNGFEGPCSADLHHQGGGLWFLLIGIAPAVFPKSFAEAAGEDAWKAIKNLYRELREALGQDDDSHVSSTFERAAKRKPNGRLRTEKPPCQDCHLKGSIRLKS